MNTSIYILLAVASLVLTLGISSWEIQHPAVTTGIPVNHSTGMYNDKMNNVLNQLGMQHNKASNVNYDTTITSDVEAAIRTESVLNLLQFNVDSVKGVTTLRVSVNSQQNSDKAR